jgi:transposase/regulator of replication initiation timing
MQVEESITDIQYLLSSLQEKIRHLESKVQILEKENSFLRYKLHQVELENSRLRERLSGYESVKKDSHNSHIPPSKQALSSGKVHRTISLREKSGKSTGGQPGHPGISLEFSKVADKTTNYLPYYCPKCGTDLADERSVSVEEKWSIDLPVIVPETVLHRIHSKQCSCGCVVKADAPAGLKAFVSYGSNVKALTGYLNTEHHIPYKRLCEIFHDVFGLSISEGSINNLLESMKSLSEPMYEQIRSRVVSSPVVGADETGLNINGKQHWQWSFQTDRLTYVYPDASRGKTAIDKHFPNGLPDSYLVTDRHSSYFKMNVKGHQICLAHLLRELIYLQELEPKETWSKKMWELLREAIHKRKNIPWEKIDRKNILDRFDQLLYSSLQVANREIENLKKSLIKHRENVFRFLFNHKIPYDNNASERSIRPMKLKQKVAGTFRSLKGAMTYAVIHSIADTARKNNQSPFYALRLIAQG